MRIALGQSDPCKQPAEMMKPLTKPAKHAFIAFIMIINYNFNHGRQMGLRPEPVGLFRSASIICL